MISWSNGTWIFLPLGRFKKSYRFSSGTIQRLSSSSVLIRCRPKSSITSVPQLLFSCSGASLMPVDVLSVTSRLSIVNSPPTTIVGRRMRTQRLSILRWSMQARRCSQRRFFVVAGVEQRMISPSTPIARGIQMSCPNALRHALGDAGLAVAGGAVQEQAAARVDRRPQPAQHPLVDQQVVEGARFRSSTVGCCLVSDWALTLSM